MSIETIKVQTLVPSKVDYFVSSNLDIHMTDTGVLIIYKTNEIVKAYAPGQWLTVSYEKTVETE